MSAYELPGPRHSCYLDGELPPGDTPHRTTRAPERGHFATRRMPGKPMALRRLRGILEQDAPGKRTGSQTCECGQQDQFSARNLILQLRFPLGSVGGPALSYGRSCDTSKLSSRRNRKRPVLFLTRTRVTHHVGHFRIDLDHVLEGSALSRWSSTKYVKIAVADSQVAH